MPFQKKVKTLSDQVTDPKANTSADTKKIEKKIDVAADVKAKRELYEKNEEIEQLKKELASAKQVQVIPVNAPGLNEIAELRAQIQLISSQVRTGATGDKLKFRMPVASDLVPPEKAITFTARAVYYIVGSYLDKGG